MKKAIFLLIGVIVVLFSLSVVFIPWMRLILYVIYSPLNEETNFLVLGLDKDIQGTRRTDVIMFVSVNSKSKEIRITSVPRDLIINGKKINSYYQRNGLENLIGLIEGFFGKKVDRYVIVDYDVIKIIGDEIGPIEVYVNQPMKYTDYSQNLVINFEPGLHKLYGEELLAFMRFRKDYNGDLGRIERQKYIIEQLLKTALKKDIFTLSRTFKKVFDLTETNVKTSELVFLAVNFRDRFNLKGISFPVEYDVDGNIYPGDMKQLKEKYSQNVQDKENEYVFYIVNNTEYQTRIYNVNLYYMWKAAGVIPEAIFFLDKKIWNYPNDLVYILNEKVSIESVKKIVKTVHPKRNFVIKYAKDDLEGYYKLIDLLTSSRNYIDFPVDFIVILH
ncbi:transcriptional regulator [Thermosipho melanesiensis]|uniref:Cell envelope-related transcriptional attenuator n=2 Tax=Thermosipho melanesiensis TaxID=46541 RepID=A6LNA5_THEM4|nr:LCP family protein [Thermosipho melanesiensis]ABR31406.1 cell envelope-related transcriptional attenuator [Thermosipho melanesiensis BI429]APT74465.1 transcriptional regulator [Thermosipho melanesiensis]OOC36425.1 transcriptional regulator [Thermosipho melanesiensis]OOC37243.1 transcriptional regulator [Thermosipho melanesiensis]OOC37995.1 transcriptional regulator [Thermosipho melanesiensis]